MGEINLKGEILGRCAKCGGEVVKVETENKILILCDYCNEMITINKGV